MRTWSELCSAAKPRSASILLHRCSQGVGVKHQHTQAVGATPGALTTTAPAEFGEAFPSPFGSFGSFGSYGSLGSFASFLPRVAAWKVSCFSPRRLQVACLSFSPFLFTRCHQASFDVYLLLDIHGRGGILAQREGRDTFPCALTTRWGAKGGDIVLLTQLALHRGLTCARAHSTLQGAWARLARSKVHAHLGAQLSHAWSGCCAGGAAGCQHCAPLKVPMFQPCRTGVSSRP